MDRHTCSLTSTSWGVPGLHPLLCAFGPVAEPLCACLLVYGMGDKRIPWARVCEGLQGPVWAVVPPSVAPSTVGLKPQRAGAGWPHQCPQSLHGACHEGSQGVCIRSMGLG